MTEEGMPSSTPTTPPAEPEPEVLLLWRRCAVELTLNCHGCYKFVIKSLEGRRRPDTKKHQRAACGSPSQRPEAAAASAVVSRGRRERQLQKEVGKLGFFIINNDFRDFSIEICWTGREFNILRFANHL